MIYKNNHSWHQPICLCSHPHLPLYISCIPQYQETTQISHAPMFPGMLSPPINPLKHFLTCPDQTDILLNSNSMPHISGPTPPVLKLFVGRPMSFIILYTWQGNEPELIHLCVPAS